MKCYTLSRSLFLYCIGIIERPKIGHTMDYCIAYEHQWFSTSLSPTPQECGPEHSVGISFLFLFFPSPNADRKETKYNKSAGKWKIHLSTTYLYRSDILLVYQRDGTTRSISLASSENSGLAFYVDDQSFVASSDDNNNVCDVIDLNAASGCESNNDERLMRRERFDFSQSSFSSSTRRW